jgi:GntR family transcriptional regulator
MAGNIFDHWQIEYNSGIPVYRQIINQVCAAVAAGAFQPGDQLPTIRVLHERLNVNPNTVAKAYRELELKGIIESERGSGSFVKAQPPVPAPDAGAKKAMLNNLYDKLVAQAANSGLTETEVLSFISERNTAKL